MNRFNLALTNKIKNEKDKSFETSLVHQNYLRTKNAYKEFVLNLVSESETIMIFTLTFNPIFKVGINQAEKDAKHFKNTLDKSIYGKTNNKWRNRTPGCLVVEGNDYSDSTIRTHIHGILGFDITSVPYCKRLIRKHWKAIKASGFITDIEEWDFRDEWIHYLLKSKTKDVPFDDAIAVLDRKLH